MIANIPLKNGFTIQKPDKIIIHSMSEFISYQNEDFYAPYFLNKIGLSVHAIVTTSGVIIRCRDDRQGAYHAKGFNLNSLGVEFLVPGIHTYDSFLEKIKTNYLTKEQYNAGVKLVKKWMKDFNIKDVRRHSDISPERKFDPGNGFPWTKFLNNIKGE